MSPRFISVFLLGCLWACSSSDKPPTQPDPLATSDGFCQAWGAAACNDNVVTACSGAATATDALRSACKLQQTTFCNTTLPAGYVSTYAQACLNAVAAAYLDGRLSGSEAATVRDFGPPCDQLIKGPVADGGSCAKDLDCDTSAGSVCIQKGGSGTCGVPTEVGAGTSCAAPSAVCGSGFYCDTGMHCVSQQTEGQSCVTDAECAAGLACTSQLCATKAPANACTADADCGTDKACQFATGSTTGNCVAQIILSPTDSTCQDLK